MVFFLGREGKGVAEHGVQRRGDRPAAGFGDGGLGIGDYGVMFGV